MKKGPFKMKKFSGFGNESPVKHNKIAEEVGMLRPDGGMNAYNPATGKYMRPGGMSFAVGSYAKTAGLQKNPRSRRSKNTGLENKYGKGFDIPTGVKMGI